MVSRVRSSLVSRRQREALTSNKIRVQRLINNITQNLPSTAVTGFWLFPVLRLHSAHSSAAHLSSALSPISHRAGSLSTRRAADSIYKEWPLQHLTWTLGTCTALVPSWDSLRIP